MEDSSTFVITIRRQLGSGGAVIGQKLADKLGIFYADSIIITEAAQKLRISESELKSREEKALFWRRLIESYKAKTDNYLPTEIAPIDRQIFEAQTEIIERIAKERSAVIIGRCSNYILREHPNHVSVFLHADIDFRIERIQKLFNISEDSALKMINQSDKERASYTNKYISKDWTDLRQYDLSINTSKLGLDGTVEFITKYLEQKGLVL